MWSETRSNLLRSERSLYHREDTRSSSWTKPIREFVYTSTAPRILPLHRSCETIIAGLLPAAESFSPHPAVKQPPVGQCTTSAIKAHVS